ncbi:MAG: hypothetical protein ACO2PN_04770 [Pyrobaculum sp.]|jgi:hypothetical protein
MDRGGLYTANWEDRRKTAFNWRGGASVEEVGRIEERRRMRAKIRGWFMGEDGSILFVEDPRGDPR